MGYDNLCGDLARGSPRDLQNRVWTRGLVMVARRSSDVGILLHVGGDTCPSRLFSDRVCAVDIELPGITLRAIGVYMPHVLFDDVWVEVGLSQLDDLIQDRRD